MPLAGVLSACLGAFMDSWEFSVNGVAVRPPRNFVIPRKGNSDMATATIQGVPNLEFGAAPLVVRENFLVALKNKAIRTALRAGGWARDMSSRTGLTKVTSAARRYVAKAYSIVATVARAAGAIPLTVLALTSRSGQKVVKQGAKAVWGVLSWIGRIIAGTTGWTARRFGKPGNAVADKAGRATARAKTWARSNWQKLTKVAAPYTSPERTYMKGAKVVSYVMVASGLISRFLGGVWVIPAYLGAAVVGAMLSPTIRRNVLVNRIIGAFESDAKAQGRKTIAEAMEAMVAQYGPDMDAWSTAAKSDYAVQQAIYNALDGVDQPFRGLSGNQRKKAEKWIKDFEAGVNKIVNDTVAAAEGEVHVDNSGHVVVEGAVA